ncbi:MAG: glycosyltransferase family 2 protein [Saprospiraceae bacterium]|nr:glycosyltransferase family 2 protein [Saprospiraceae bacterium]MBP8212962.1 glycosyltransferase family 2 protein [Saprospiraceae bacterium]MBP9056272.1 glycosyltransferase family 2 protein [Saprospiraceae bacterium]
MRVAGFTFIKNAILYDYPIYESISSILPLCDELVVAVGKSDDATLELIKSINSPKIQIIETIWDESQREGGRVLALETDKAFQAISDQADWCFYIQGDEVIHENDYDNIRNAMAKYKDDPKIDGLLFEYCHLYGSYDYRATSSGWYRNEIRIVKNIKRIYSFRDAQGFRKDNNKKLCVAKSGATVYHYGWVKPPSKMQAKQKSFQKLWHNDQWVSNHVADSDEFDYSGIDVLEPFNGTHPLVMQERIASKNWKFDRDISQNRKTVKETVKKWFRQYLGLDFTYKNYILKK